MGTTTAWLERSLRNCSLNHSSSTSSDRSDVLHHHHHRRNHPPPTTTTTAAASSSFASSSDDNSTLIDLHSHVSLPYHWEQCLDLKTGELYYVNWSTGLKAKQDPRTLSTGYSGDYDSEEEDDDDEEDDEEEGISSTYESEVSPTESSSCSESLRSSKSHQRQRQQVKEESVLVVAGCKSCLMYYMLPKHAHQCPKCCGQLLHFPANNTPSP